MDNVGIVVESLDEAISFFEELGLKVGNDEQTFVELRMSPFFFISATAIRISRCPPAPTAGKYRPS